jgi:chromosome segregation ATPase
MRYILSYFALMLGLSGLSLLWAGNAYGFVLVLIAAALIYVLVRMERMRRRERRYGGYGEAIEGYEKRFTEAERALESELPQNELDNPALIELLSAYENDADDAEAIRRLYAQLQQRFSDWRDEFDRLHALNEAGAVGLPERFAERYDDLDRQLSQLLADVKRLERRAAEIEQVLEDPLDQIAEGALMLEQAEATCARAFGSKIPDELSAKLRLGRQKLAEARGAIAAGAERPLDAVRLAQEVCALARTIQRRVLGRPPPLRPATD